MSHPRWHPLRTLCTLWGLLGFAVAQPVFDLARRNPTFLIEHEAGFALRGLLVACSWLLPGLVLTLPLLLLRRRGEGWALAGTASMVGLLGALIVMPVWSDVLPSALAWPAGAATALAIGLLWLRWRPLRELAAVSLAGALIFSALFLWPQAATTRGQLPAPADSDASIFVVVLDELPLVSLLREIDAIDAELFPNFSRLAEDAVWFRNATTANAYTERSVPILLSGVAPRKEQRPVLADHPDNLFTLFRDSHRFVVSESITRLCPPALTRRDRLAAGERAKLLLADASLVWLHRILPTAQLRALPPIEGRWFDFWGLQPERADVVERFRDWIAAIEPGERPLLGVVHLLYPHNPYVRHPDGTRYSQRRQEPFLDRTRWIGDEWAPLQAWFRARLQLQHQDRLLGEFLDRLRELGLYEDAIIAVVADHGASYRPGLPFRNPIEANRMDMLAIPMFVKLRSGERAGEIDERLVSSLDLMPTLLDAAGVPEPWPMDGHSMRNPQQPGREWIEVHQPMAEPPLQRLPKSELARRDELLARMQQQLLPRREGSFGPHAGLVGRKLVELRLGEELPGEIHLHVDATPDLDELRGSLETPEPQTTPTDLVVADDERILAVTRSVHDPPGTRASYWLALLPQGRTNRSLELLQFFALGAGGELRPLRFAAGAPSFLDRRLGLGSTADLAVEGFHRDVPEAGVLSRWTDGHGVVEVPMRPDAPARALRVAIRSSGPEGCELEILVDGHPLLRESLPAGAWETELPLPREWQSALTRIELRSSSFVPSRSIEGSRDDRRLGVQLLGIWLLSGPVDSP